MGSIVCVMQARQRDFTFPIKNCIQIFCNFCKSCQAITAMIPKLRFEGYCIAQLKLSCPTPTSGDSRDVKGFQEKCIPSFLN